MHNKDPRDIENPNIYLKKLFRRNFNPENRRKSMILDLDKNDFRQEFDKVPERVRKSDSNSQSELYGTLN